MSIQLADDLLPSNPYPIPAAARVAVLPGPFRMAAGGVLPRLEVAFETWGQLSPAKDNVILLFTGLSPNSHVCSSDEDPTPGWWEFMVGPGKPIDTERYYVICVNSLGSCFGSTGPASIDPRSGQPYRLNFPQLSIEDIAKMGHELMVAQGIERLHTVMGTSLGGMVALSYAVQYPHHCRHFATISSAAKACAYAISLRSLQREIVRSDPAWQNGQYAFDAGPRDGMRLARKLGLISYRSAEEFQHRFGRERVAEEPENPHFSAVFEVESYLENNARKFVGHFDANSYLYLSRAMDLFDLSERWGSMVNAFDRIEVKNSLVIGVSTDRLYPLQQQQDIADCLVRSGHDVSFHALDSIQGHDAFLVDKEQFAPIVGEFFSKIAR